MGEHPGLPLVRIGADPGLPLVRMGEHPRVCPESGWEMETYSLGLAIGRSYNSFKAGELYIGEERDFIKEQLKCITIPVLLPTNPVQSSLYLTRP